MDNPEKPATQHTTRRLTKQKHNTICVGHHYTQTNTYNANQTWIQSATYTCKMDRRALKLHEHDITNNTQGLQRQCC